MPKMRPPEGGALVDVPDDEVAAYASAGFTVPTAGAEVAETIAARQQADYSTPLRKAYTGVTSVLSGASGGVTDVLAGVAGGGEGLRRSREANPEIDLAGQVVGGLLPTSPGALVGARVLKGGKEATTIGQIARAGKAGAAEGAIIGLGQGASEIALSDDPLTAEQALSTLTSRAIYGGAIGGAAGSLAKSAEIGLVKGKRALDDFANKRQVAADVGDDLASLDIKGLQAAEKAEKDAIEAARVTQRQGLADDITAFRRDLKSQKHAMITKDINLPAADGKLGTAELGRIAIKANKQLDNILDNPIALAKNPGKALDALQRQENALARLAERTDDLKAAYDKLRAPTTKTTAAGELVDAAGKPAVSWREFTGQRMGAYMKSEGGHGPAITKIGKEWQEYKATLRPATGETVSVAGASDNLTQVRLDALNTVPAALERNRALQAKIAGVTGDATSPRLQQIAQAKEALAAGGRGGQSLAEQAATGAAFSLAAGAVAGSGLPGSEFVAPLIGAKAAGVIGSKVFGRMAGAIGEKQARTAKALAKVFEAGARVTKYAPPLATRVLSKVAFAPERDDVEPVRGKGLPALYKQRSQELREQVTSGPDGKLVTKPHVRQQIADRLQPIAAFQPMLADRMETLAARRLEFLAGKLPKRPEIAGIPIGPDRWQPSEMEMRAFARYVAAVEDPDGVFERVADGTLTPEDAEAMREVYPEQLQAFTFQVLERLPSLRQSLPYHRRLSLSVLTGVPVDPSMDPRILGALQSIYAASPEPATPKPQFGSVKNTEVGTPSERRQARE